MKSLDYVPGSKHPPSPDYVPDPEEPEQASLSPDYVPEPEYPVYLVDIDVPEDPEVDPADYPADEGDDDDDESSNDDDDDDDDDVEENEEDEEDKEEDEHLASADSFDVPTVDPVLSAEDTEEFETDEYAPTPVPSPRHRMARMSVRPQIPMSDTAEALIGEYASAPTSPSPPPFPLSPLSSLIP
ncbi:hypothetical protein Tco_0675804 [Tanacetum coccineum]